MANGVGWSTVGATVELKRSTRVLGVSECFVRSGSVGSLVGVDFFGVL